MLESHAVTEIFEDIDKHMPHLRGRRGSKMEFEPGQLSYEAVLRIILYLEVNPWEGDGRLLDRRDHSLDLFS